jgi:Tol biopolymer transport system component
LTDSIVIVSPTKDKNIANSFKGLNQKWLPNSNRMAFLRFDKTLQSYNLWTFSTFDGVEKQITTSGVTAPGTSSFPFNRTQTRDFSWSNDSLKVVCVGLKRQNILLTSPENGETVNLTNNSDANLNFHCPIWSTEGKQIAYISAQKPATSSEQAKWSVHLFENGESKVIFSTNQSLRFLGWTNNNRELLFESTNGAMKADPSDIKLLQVSLTGENKIINSFEQISALSMALSPDAKNVVFTKETDRKDNVYLTGINKTDSKKLTNNADSFLFYGSLAWSSDNKTIYFDKQERINTISMYENFR